MNTQKQIDYFIQEIETTRKQIEELEERISNEKKYLERCKIEYRIASVNRILNFVRSEYRAGRICDLEILLCHCQNKIHGNIDCIELDLAHHRGVPFEKLPAKDEAKQILQEGE